MMLDLPHSADDAHRILKSISRFSVLPEVQEMRIWLAQELARLDRVNRHELDSQIYHQRQGACQVLEKLIELQETADRKAEAIRNNRSGR